MQYYDPVSTHEKTEGKLIPNQTTELSKSHWTNEPQTQTGTRRTDVCNNVDQHKEQELGKT